MKFLTRPVIALALLIPSVSPADEPAPVAAPSGVSINAVAFLEGTWRSEDDHGYNEETWSAPKGNNAIGCFRWLKPDGTPSMIELLAITAEDNTLKLRLRHHNAQLVGWKSEAEPNKPLELALKEVTDNRVVFHNTGNGNDLSGISYHRTDAGTLAIEVAFNDPKRETLKFSLTKPAQPAAAVNTNPGAVSNVPHELAWAGYERFKALAGLWRGKSTKGWTEEINYQTIAAGWVVMETSFEAHPNETMATMFHMDGSSLILTHYCVAKNQPRCRATSISPDARQITFEFDSATNLPSRDKGHMDKVVFNFIDDDHFTSKWTWYQDGKESWMEEIQHQRLNPSPAERERTEPAPAGSGEGEPVQHGATHSH